MEYLLMRRDDVITICDIADDGTMVSWAPRFRNPELAPLEYRESADHIGKWWKNRQIPIRQGRVEAMLRERGLAAPGEFLLKNLGLSLTDYYWIRPIDSVLRWKDVNLYDNDFRENLMTARGTARGASSDSGSASCTPNSSLRGELEKSWVIRNGRRVLIKGNHGVQSSESINEVIATELHRKQGYDNYTRYHLIRIKGKAYDYGCWSEAFTSDRYELVSAHALLTSGKKPTGMSEYEFLIRRAGEEGADEQQVRRDLEYQIISDYVLSNVDRHMDNIGFLRDADTLKLVRMAPIFDTGRAFGGRGVVPYTDEEIDNIEVNSFDSNETELLKHVTDRSVFAASRALSAKRIEALYGKDSKARPGRIKSIVRLYEKKLERLENWQLSR